MRTLGKKYILIFSMIILLSGCNNSDQLRDASIVNSSYTNTNEQSNNQKIPREKQSYPSAVTGKGIKTDENVENKKVEESSVTRVSNQIISNKHNKVQADKYKSESTFEVLSIVNSMYKKIFIGEMFESGFIYIEPFSIERNTYNEVIKFENYPNSIKFNPLSIKNSSYVATFCSEFATYIPKIEEKSHYFMQAFSEPNQYGLCYKLEKTQNVSFMGVALTDYEIEKNIVIVQDEKRPYSQSEYKNALNQIEKDKEIKESDRTLSYISLEDTIVGALKICLLSIKDTQFDILISKYRTHGFEYAAEVYVADFIKEGKVIKTYEKYNWDGPY